MLSLQGKVAIVTGSAQGIGRVTAIKIAQQGARTAIVDLNLEGAENVAREIKEIGGEAIPLKVDVTDFDQINGMVDRLRKQYGRIDILVNNVGWNRTQDFVNDTPEFWEKIISLNLKAHIFCSHAALKVMIEQRYGKIVNIGSDSGRVGNPRDAVYSACKSGLMGLTKSLAREMGKYGININCICPGPTETQLLHSSFSDQAQEEAFIKAMEKMIPLRRIGKPEDVAHTVLFLVSDEAQYVTGQVLSVSGGLTMV